MRNKTVLITGGIGKQTALALAKMGAHVIVTGRSRANGEATVDEVQQLSDSQTVDLFLGDLSTLAGVRSLATHFQQKRQCLDMLINNAVLAASERRLAEDGIGTDFAVNVIAPFCSPTF